MALDENRKYTAALIGVGRAGQGTPIKGGGHQIGYTHAKTHKNNPRIDLVAAADINYENLTAFQEIFEVPQGFEDYRKMLTEVQPDIVSICTYVGLHRQMIVDAAKAGVKGILCEKPFLASPADLPVIQRIVDETGVKIAVAHVRRYLPTFARAQELYTSGAVGQPLMCIAGIEGWDLSEWGSHWLDMFRFFHNDQPVKWVFGQMRVRDSRGYGHAMEEHGVAYFEFINGGKGLLDGGQRMNGEELMTLVGTEGTIRILSNHDLVITSTVGSHTESYADDPRSEWLAAWDAFLMDLVQWVEGGSEPMTGMSNMILTSELNLSVYLSAIRGDRIDLPLQDKLNEWPVDVLSQRRL
jgi:predicted dehydrogenase